MTAWFAALKREFNSPMFDISELSFNEGETPPRLDIEKTLSPHPRPLCIAAKLFIMVWVISTMVVSIVDEAEPYFWLAYFSHWGLVFTVWYIVMSCVSAIYLTMRPPKDPGTLEGTAGLLFKTTWVRISSLDSCRIRPNKFVSNSHALIM